MSISLISASALATARRMAASTSFPSRSISTPLTISMGVLGVPIPAMTSGQYSMTSLSLTNSRTLVFRLFPPLYLQFLPKRQALTKTFIRFSSFF